MHVNNKEISKAHAVKKFAGRNVTVQEAHPRERNPGDPHQPGFRVEFVPLKEEHILSAVERADGAVVIVTIDGRRLRSDLREPQPSREEDE